MPRPIRGSHAGLGTLSVLAPKPAIPKERVLLFSSNWQNLATVKMGAIEGNGAGSAVGGSLPEEGDRPGAVQISRQPSDRSPRPVSCPRKHLRPAAWSLRPLSVSVSSIRSPLLKQPPGMAGICREYRESDRRMIVGPQRAVICVSFIFIEEIADAVFNGNAARKGGDKNMSGEYAGNIDFSPRAVINYVSPSSQG